MKLRILSVGGQYLTQSLRQLGHAVLSVCPDPEADIPLPHPETARNLLEQAAGRGFIPDMLFYADDGNLPLLINPESAPCPSLYYSIDTYCNPWHLPYARGFDLVLAAQKDFLSLFADEGLPAQWFPLFCRSVDEAAPFDARDIPVAFVGTLGHKNNPGREPFLRNFRALHPLVMRSGDFFPVFRRSRIVLNQTAFSEVNFAVLKPWAAVRPCSWSSVATAWMNCSRRMKAFCPHTPKMMRPKPPASRPPISPGPGNWRRSLKTDAALWPKGIQAWSGRNA